MNISSELSILRKQFLKIQFTIISLLLLLSFTGYLLRHFRLGSSYGLSYFFVDNEMTVTTWYSSILLFLCAVLLSTIALIQASKRKPYFRHWQLLAVIFLYLSLDEAVAIHEKWGKPVKRLLSTDGLFYHAWVIPAILLVSIFLMVYLRFLAHLPPKIRRLSKISGIIYITGAIGFEMISGVLINSGGTKEIAYILCTHIEEGLELLGLSIFLYGLLDYISFILQDVIIHFGWEPQK